MAAFLLFPSLRERTGLGAVLDAGCGTWVHAGSPARVHIDDFAARLRLRLPKSVQCQEGSEPLEAWAALKNPPPRRARRYRTERKRPVSVRLLHHQPPSDQGSGSCS